MKRIVYRVFLGLLGAVFALVVGIEVVKLWCDAHFYDGYDSALPLNAKIIEETERPAYKRIKLSFEGLPGETVPTVMAMPKSSDKPVPCVIFLHGIGQDKRFLDEIAEPFVQAGFAMVTFDQYTRGERKPKDKNLLRDGAALRRRGALTVIETRRLVDYLQTRPDVAHERIYLVGASYGAITGSTAVAFEPRIRAVALIYGGGRLRLLLDSNASRKETGRLGKWGGLVRQLSCWFLAPSDPVRYVSKISPRPILFQNGTEDSLIPKAAAQALFDAAREPKSITWYPGDHIGSDVPTVRKVLDEALNWIKGQDKQS